MISFGLVHSRSRHHIPINLQNRKIISRVKIVISLIVKPRSQSPGKELWCVFQAVGGIPFQDAEPAGVSTGNRAHRFELKQELQYGVRFVLCYSMRQGLGEGHVWV